MSSRPYNSCVPKWKGCTKKSINTNTSTNKSALLIQQNYDTAVLRDYYVII